VDGEDVAERSGPFLSVKNRAAIIELDRQCDAENYWRENEQCRPGKDHIEESFEDVILPVQWLQVYFQQVAARKVIRQDVIGVVRVYESTNTVVMTGLDCAEKLLAVGRREGKQGRIDILLDDHLV